MNRTTYDARGFLRGSAARIALAMVALSWLGSSLWAIAPTNPTIEGTQDEVFRIMRQDSVTAGDTNGDGTATVFDWAIQTVEGVDYLRMCMVTADHVLNGTTLGGLGFRNENPQGTFGTDAFDFTPFQSVVKLGSAGVPAAGGWAGGGNDTPDIAFVGVTVKLSNVGGTGAAGLTNNDKSTLLQDAAADAVPLGSIGHTVFPAFTFNGFGNSGRAPVAADVANGWNGFQYIHHNGAPNDEQYGILRDLSETITINEYANAQNGALTGGTYKYEEALGWQLVAGKPYGLGGDSGSAMIDSTGHIVGIFNLSDGTPLRVNNNPLNPVVAEGVNTGDLEYGVALTSDYTDWLEASCYDFMNSPVPEPGTIVLVFVAIPLLGFQAWRRRRAQVSAAE